jgi:hypothetical protein
VPLLAWNCLLWNLMTVAGRLARFGFARPSRPAPGAFQQLVDPAYLGRMGAVTSLGDDVLMPVAMVGFGALIGGVGLPLTCLLAGLGFVALVSWALARLRDARPVELVA